MKQKEMGEVEGLGTEEGHLGTENQNIYKQGWTNYL